MRGMWTATISDAVQKGSQVLLFSLHCGTGPSSTFPLRVFGGAASRSPHYSLNGIETSASSPFLCMSFTGSFTPFFLWKLLWNRGIDRNEGKTCCQGANEESEKKGDGASADRNTGEGLYVGDKESRESEGWEKVARQSREVPALCLRLANTDANEHYQPKLWVPQIRDFLAKRNYTTLNNRF